jgi:hypothetical protein
VRLWGAFLAGGAVTFPATLPGFVADSFPRFPDLLSLFCTGLIVLAFLRAAPLNRAIYGTLIVWAMAVPWALMEIWALGGAPDMPVQRVLVRWILCGSAAYVITVITERPILRTWFLYGLLIGVVCSLMTVVYDFLTFSPLDMSLKDLVDSAITDDSKDIYEFVWRAYGIFGHPNTASACLLIGVPILLGAIEEGRAPRWSVVFALALMGAAFYLTKSRGSLVVSAALLAYWTWSRAKGVRLPLLLAGGVAVLGALAAGGLVSSWGDRVLLDRFLDVDSISINAGDRWWTIATSLDLILLNPLGMGSAYVQPLEIATGTSATHNAYLELALMGGVILMVFVTVRLVKAAAHLLSPQPPIEAWLAAYLLGIFAFENYFLQVNILLITLWLVVTPLRSLARQAASHGKEATLPGPHHSLVVRSTKGDLAR